MWKTTDGTKDNKRVMVQTIWGAPSAKVILFKINVEKQEFENMDDSKFQDH